MPCLYIVSTPIGNLEDITYRAVRILKEVDAIVCEDTRHTRTLLDHYEIKKPMYSFHERSSDKDLKFIVSLLESGKNLAYVTDAGTPGIADPGNKLVSWIMDHGSKDDLMRDTSYVLRDISVVPVPGPSALTAAISICGFNMQEFRFFGFLPHKKGRRTRIKEIVESNVPVVLFESKYRIQKLFEEFIAISTSVVGARLIAPLQEDNEYSNFKHRQCFVANDLTKKFETVYRGAIEEVASQLAQNTPKGEFVVIINHFFGG